MNVPTRLASALQQLPLIAILRGLSPAEAPSIGAALAAAGFAMLEVPLNSPRPLRASSRWPTNIPVRWWARVLYLRRLRSGMSRPQAANLLWRPTSKLMWYAKPFGWV